MPWTRPVFDGKTTDAHGTEVSLMEYAVQQRERLVLKPTHDFAGHGVALGWRESDSEWAESLKHAVDTDYIVQEKVTLHRREYPLMEPGLPSESYYEDTDPFLFLGRLGGFLTRLSPSEITNVHAGGSVVASFVIAPRN